MGKEYKDSTGSERVASAEKMAKEKYSPMDTLRKLVSPKQEPVPPTPPAGLPEGKKKGGSVKAKAKPKCMARGGGIEVRGKTRGKII